MLDSLYSERSEIAGFIHLLTGLPPTITLKAQHTKHRLFSLVVEIAVLILATENRSSPWESQRSKTSEMLQFSPNFVPLILSLHILSILLVVPTSFLYLRLRIMLVACFGLPLLIYHLTYAVSLALSGPALITVKVPYACLLRTFLVVWSSRAMCWLVGFFAIRLWIVVTPTQSYYLKFNIGAWLTNLALVLPLIPAFLATVPQLFQELIITDPVLLQCKSGFMTKWQNSLVGWPWFILPAIMAVFSVVSIICHYAMSRSLILHMLLTHIRSASISIRVLGASLFTSALVALLFVNDVFVRRRTPRLIPGIDYLDIDDIVSSLYGVFFFLIMGTTLQGWRSIRWGRSTCSGGQFPDHEMLATMHNDEPVKDIEKNYKILMNDTGMPGAVMEPPPLAKNASALDSSRLQPLDDDLLAFSPPPLSPRIARPPTPNRIEPAFEPENKPVRLATKLKRNSMNSNSSNRFTLSPVCARKSQHSNDLRRSGELSEKGSIASSGNSDSIGAHPETFGEGFFDWKRKISLAAVGGANKAALAKARRSMLGLEPESGLPARKPVPVELPPPIPKAYQP